MSLYIMYKTLMFLCRKGIPVKNRRWEVQIWDKGEQVPAILYQYLTLVYLHGTHSQAQYLLVITCSNCQCQGKNIIYM